MHLRVHFRSMYLGTLIKFETGRLAMEDDNLYWSLRIPYIKEYGRVRECTEVRCMSVLRECTYVREHESVYGQLYIEPQIISPPNT